MDTSHEQVLYDNVRLFLKNQHSKESKQDGDELQNA